MNWWTTLLKEQQAVSFAALAGARGTLVVPIADTLLSRALSEWLRGTGSVRGVTVNARQGNTVVIGVRLARPAFLPEIPVTLRIERQPELPASALLVLRTLSLAGLPGGVASLMKFVNGVPDGITFRGDTVEIDLHMLFRRSGVHEDAMRYIRRLHVNTIPDAVVVALEASVPIPGDALVDYSAEA